MRPLRLVMQAFGPYVERQEIDFTALGTRQFFLVHGPTGAGKTTIFDAICYALYGTTSGAERDAKHMRSDYAPEDLTTEVTLDFAVGRERYRVRRRPEQEVRKKKGEGTRIAPATAELLRIDENGTETESLGDKYVNPKIVDIIGFEVHQFRQVVLLPQGDFRKLLLAGSNGREAILAKLFSTDVFARVTERLRDKARDLANAYQEHNRKRESYLEAADADSVEMLEQRRDELEKTLATTKEEILATAAAAEQAQQALTAGEQLDERFRLAAKVSEQQAQLARKKPEMDARAALCLQLQHAAEMQDRYHAWQQLTADGKGIRDRLQAVEEALPASKEKAEYWERERQALRETEEKQNERVRELAELQQQQLRRQRWQEARTEAEQQRTKLQRAHDAQAATEQRKTDAETALSEATNRMQNIMSIIGLADNVRPAIAHARSRVQAYDDWQTSVKDLAKATAERVSAETAQQAADAAATQAKTAWERIVVLREQDRLATWAATLHDGAPCPVCGACEHPQPALAAEYVPTAEEEETAQAAWQAAENRRQEMRANVAACCALETQLAADCTRREKEVGEEPRDVLAAAVKDAEALWQQVETAQTEQPLQEQALQAAQAALTQAAQAHETAQKTYHETETALARVTERMQALTEELPEMWREGDALTQRLQVLETKINEYRTRREACDTHATTDENKYQSLQREKEEYERRLTECRQQYQDEKDALTARAAEVGFDSLEQVETMLRQLGERQKYEREVTDYQLECRRVEADMQALTAELEARTPPNLEQLKQAKEQAQAASGAKQKELARTEEQLKTHQDWINRYRRESKAIAQLDEKHAVVGRLAALAGGTDTSAAAKMTFQRYVLATILDEVLTLANLRLQDMSHHRYQLKREMHATDRRSTEGLELAVIDRWTGNIRPVNTLSGGETFLASLALALGLADTAQAYAGGLRMDMMLIDEGFGTLDGEALDEAIRVLLELRTGGRLVGIISHVDELRRRIDTRLEIQKTEQGSRARWVLG